jgi:CheY-like chemotaxis protein
LPRGSETILVVEDREALRTLIERMLVQNGYRVLMASEPVEAIRMAQQHAGPINLLLTDVVLPGCSGKELAQELLQRRPDTQVIYMSGYTDSIVFQQGLQSQSDTLILKPFSEHQLLRVVREQLARPQNGVR